MFRLLSSQLFPQSDLCSCYPISFLRGYTCLYFFLTSTTVMHYMLPPLLTAVSANAATLGVTKYEHITPVLANLHFTLIWKCGQ